METDYYSHLNGVMKYIAFEYGVFNSVIHFRLNILIFTHFHCSLLFYLMNNTKLLSLNCFQFVVVMNKTAINILVKILVHACLFSMSKPGVQSF
jgi:hypothetical protein